MPSPFDSLPKAARDKLQKVDPPDWVDPMLAHLTDDYFSDPDWIYERKLDGERCLAHRTGEGVRLLSRNRKDLNVQYPELVEALGAVAPEWFILDGEVVAFSGNVTSFSRLQDRMHVTSEEEARASSVAVYYYLFDLLYLDEYDTTALPLRTRKSLLKKVLRYEDPLRFLTHRNEEGVAYYRDACDRGWEGVIAKDATAPYTGGRSRKWRKFKCVNRQEFVIGGYTDPQGKRIEFGALLLGYYEGDDLVYAGNVGTGYDEEALRRLGAKLSDLERKTAPFTGGDLPTDVHWVSPQLVAQIGFTEWTDDGKLRHPRFLGLRQDKAPEDVARERPG